MNPLSEKKFEQPHRPVNFSDILDNTQGHLILKWNAWKGAEKIRRVGLTTIYSIIAITFLAIFSFDSYFHQQYDHAAALVIIILLTVSSHIYLRFTGNTRRTNTFIVTILGVFCLYLLYTGGINNTGPLWFYVFPLYALFAQRLWAGIFSVVILFILTSYLLYGPASVLDPEQYSPAFKQRFLAVYVTVSAMSLVYAFLRASAEMELANLNEHLRKAADIDELTGLINRRRMTSILYQEISRYHRTKRPLTIIMTDIDHFKKYNDRHGHLCGDLILQEASKTLTGTLRNQDTCARWGGEEFMIMLPDTDSNGALVIAERLRKAIENIVFDYEGNKISFTMSFGVNEYTGDKNLTGCLRDTDRKLYEAKAAGRNRVVA